MIGASDVHPIKADPTSPNIFRGSNIAFAYSQPISAMSGTKVVFYLNIVL